VRFPEVDVNPFAVHLKIFIIVIFTNEDIVVTCFIQWDQHEVISRKNV
jgi:hypothetical protein